MLVVAHGNSLRGIIKHLKRISDDDIVNLNLPTAVPYVFEFDDRLNLTKDYFLGDPEEIRKLMEMCIRDRIRGYRRPPWRFSKYRAANAGPQPGYDRG